MLKDIRLVLIHKYFKRGRGLANCTSSILSM